MGNRKKSKAGVSTRESVVREKGSSSAVSDSDANGMGFVDCEKGKMQMSGLELEQLRLKVSTCDGTLRDGATGIKVAAGKLRGGSATLIGTENHVPRNFTLAEGEALISDVVGVGSREFQKVPLCPLRVGDTVRRQAKIPKVPLSASVLMPVVLENGIVSACASVEGSEVANLEDVQVDFSGSDEDDEPEVDEPCVTPNLGITVAGSGDPVSPKPVLVKSAMMCLKPGGLQSIIVDNRPLVGCSNYGDSAATPGELAGPYVDHNKSDFSGAIGDNGRAIQAGANRVPDQEQVCNGSGGSLWRHKGDTAVAKESNSQTNVEREHSAPAG